MSKPIAVLSSDYKRTLRWLCDTYNVTGILNKAKSFVDISSGKEYVILMHSSDVCAYEFSAVIAAPDYLDYTDLRKMAEERIR